MYSPLNVENVLPDLITPSLRDGSLFAWIPGNKLPGYIIWAFRDKHICVLMLTRMRGRGRRRIHPFAAPDVPYLPLNRDHNFPKMRPALQIPESVRRLCKGKDSINHRLEPIL